MVICGSSSGSLPTGGSGGGTAADGADGAGSGGGSGEDWPKAAAASPIAHSSVATKRMCGLKEIEINIPEFYQTSPHRWCATRGSGSPAIASGDRTDALGASQIEHLLPLFA